MQLLRVGYMLLFTSPTFFLYFLLSVLLCQYFQSCLLKSILFHKGLTGQPAVFTPSGFTSGCSGVRGDHIVAAYSSMSLVMV